jgi:uncharacterized lipoprotein YehR (DUF1307 family)
MKQTHPLRRFTMVMLTACVAVALAACGQSKADKTAEDVAAMRALMEQEAAAKKAAADKAEAENKAQFAEMKAQAASDAKKLGFSK